MIDELIAALPAELRFTAGRDRLYEGGIYVPRGSRRITVFSLVSGQALVAVGDHQASVTAGQSLMLFGESRYRYQATSAEPHVVLWSETDRLDTPLPPCPAVPVTTTKRLEMLHRLCSTEAHADGDVTQDRHLAVALIIEILHLASKSRPSGPQSTAQCLRALIASDIDRMWTVPDVADQMGLTPRTLSRRLAREGSMSAMELIWRERLLRASDLLADTDLPIWEIAAACGFRNPFHFSRRVSQAFGYAPGDLRRWMANASVSEWHRAQSTLSNNALEAP